MATAPPILPGAINYETMLLPGRTFVQFSHNTHGRVTVRRRGKTAIERQINFDVDLITPNGGVLHEIVHIVVNNAEHNIPGNPPAVGYGDIELGQLKNMSIIYIVHAAFAATGSQMGVRYLDIDTIVSPALEHVCQLTGMRTSNHPTGYYGECWLVESKCLKKAESAGWNA